MRKRRCVQVDLNTGNILAFDMKHIKEIPNLLQQNWLTINEEAYKMILLNQGQIIVDVLALSRYLQNNKISIKQDIITTDFLLVQHSLKKAKLAKKEKNNRYMNLYIDYGITYNNIIYPFTINDRLRYTEQAINNNSVKYINSEDGIVSVSKDEFNIIYNNQLLNQRKWEVYTKQYNLYVDTLKSYEQISNLGYEIELPKQYQDAINEELNITNKQEDIFDKIYNELSHIDDNNKEAMFKKLQDIEFTINEFYKSQSDTTTITEEIDDVKNLIDKKVENMVQMANRKYKKNKENLPEFWDKELEEKLTNIGKHITNKKIINRISDNNLTNIEKQQLKDLSCESIIDGVDYDTIQQVNEENKEKYKDLLRDEVEIKPIRDEELDNLLAQESDTITNSDIKDIVEELQTNETV